MGSSKTVFRRLLPRRAVRRFEEDWASSDKKDADQRLDVPAVDRPPEPTLREIFAAIRGVINGDDKRADPAPERRKSDRAEMPQAARGRPRSKAERNNLMVMVLLGCDVLLGIAIGLLGFFGLESDGLALAGAALATGGILLMLIFQLTGKER
nr:hypothetical protein [uncultured Dongia sp.]